MVIVRAWLVGWIGASALSGCLLPSFDELRCEGGASCTGGGAAGGADGGAASGGAANGGAGPCGDGGVLVTRPSGDYCIEAHEVSLARAALGEPSP